MLKYTADDYSDQLDNTLAKPQVKNPAYTEHGKERIKYFSYTAPTGNLAADSVVALCTIPKNVRIVGGELYWAAFGASTMDLGIAGADGNGYYEDDTPTADDVDFFLDGVDATATTGDTFASFANADTNAGYVTTKENVLTLKAVGGVFTATKVIKGFIKYVEA